MHSPTTPLQPASDPAERKKHTVLLLCLAVAAVTAGLCQLPPMPVIEDRCYDAQVKAVAGLREPSQEILVVAIDDQSLRAMAQEVGRWPWPRFVIAWMIEYCSEAQTIGIDLLLPEDDYAFQGSDDQLAAEVAAYGRLVAAVYLSPGEEAAPAPPGVARHALVNVNTRSGQTPAEAGAFVPPYKSLLAAVDGLGVASVTDIVEGDGVVRRYNLATRHGDTVLPSLALALAMRSREIKPEEAELDWGTVLRLRDRAVRIDTENRIRLDPPLLLHRTISAVDVLTAKYDEMRGTVPGIKRSEFRGKTVILGSTAEGVQRDKVPTSIDPALPGVYVHAIAVDNILSGNTLSVMPSWAALLLALALGALVALCPTDRPMVVLAACAVLSVAYGAATIPVLALTRCVLPLTAPILAVLSCGAAIGIRRWRSEHSERLRLERLEATKQQLTDMLVHDLKNRIAPVLVSLDVLEMGLDAGDDFLAKALGAARSSAARLLAETKALLDIRKMSEGRMELRPEKTRIAALIEENLPPLQTAAERQGRRVRCVTGHPEAVAEVDPDIAGRVFGNLLWNAIEHSADDSEIEVGYRQAGDEIALWVANRGPVVPEKDLEAVFEAYFSSPSGSAARRISGTGLGLAFCKLAIEAHGGAIHMESPWESHGDGVKVCFSLPSAANALGPQPG